MTDHIVDDMTVEIEDFEGNAIDTLAISNVKVTYTRDAASATLANYGYEATNLGTVTVSGAGTPISETMYQIGTDAEPVNFKYVGLYKSCSVSFTVDDITDEVSGSSVTAGTKGTKLSYKQNGSLLDTMPIYEVKWNAPDVKITGISPTYNETFAITSSSDSAVKENTAVIQYSVRNWISNSQDETVEPYAAVVYLKYDYGTWRQFNMPSVSLQLTYPGSNYKSVLLEVPQGAGVDTSQTYSFSSNSEVIEKTIGYAEGGTAGLGITSTTHYEAGEQTITTVRVTGKDDKEWTASLNHQIVINQQKIAPELTFTGLESYPGATTPGTVRTSSAGVILSQDGSNSFKCTLPSSQSWTQDINEVENVSDGVEEVVNSVVYYEKSEGALWWKTTYYYVYNRTVTTTTSEAIERDYRLSYLVDKWKINNANHAAGTEVEIEGKWTAKATPTLTGKDLLNEKSVTSIVTVTLDVSAGEKTETKPSNAKLVNESDICTTAQTETQTIEQ